MTVTVALASALAVASGCSVRAPTGTPLRDTGPLDAGTSDTAALDGSGDATSTDAASDTRDVDARTDARTSDASSDAGPPRIDAPTLDAGRDAPALDAGRADAGPADAGAVDAGTSDAGASDAGPAGTLIQCTPPIPPGATAGILFSPNFWSGFRFDIPGPVPARVTRVGIQLTPEPGPGTIFAALVRLTDANDFPDDPALGGGDVLTVVSIAVPATAGTSVVVSATLDQTLAPGWYAVVYGTGAFGATLASGNIPSAGGGGCRSLGAGRFPFTIRQSDGMFILQGAEPHMFVELGP